MKDYQKITTEDVQKVQAGDLELRNKLIEKNDRLIRKLVLKYKNYPVEMKEDFYQEAVLGFINAFRCFDINKNEASFTTYVYSAMKNNIEKYLTQYSSNMYNNRHLGIISYKLRLIKQDYYIKHGKELTEEEAYKLLKDTYGFTDGTLSNHKEALKFSQVRLDALFNADSKENEENNVLDETVNIEEEFLRQDLFREIIKIMNEELSEKERNLIIAYFDLNNGPHITQDVLGKQYGCAQAQIRKIISKALNKIKESLINKGFEEFIK